jgi:integrase
MAERGKMSKPRVLTDPFVRNLKPAAAGKRYAISDALVPGLRVRVTDRGHKSYVLWRRVNKKARSASALALGEVGQLTLAAARDKARAWLAEIESGRDPRAAERVEPEMTFGDVLADYFRRHVAGKRKAKDVQREMRNELLSRWKDKPISAITRRHIIAMVDEIKDRGATYQAHNLFGHCKTFFNWCVEKDILQSSPADHMQAARLIGARKPRQRVLNDDEIRAFWAATGEMGYPYGPLFRMLLLTGQREREVADARWGEFDLGNKLWTVPPERHKSDSTHLVPLSDDVMTILAALPRWAGGECLFSSSGGRRPPAAFSGAKSNLDELMGNPPAWKIHDLRRVVRSHLSALRIPDHVAEMVIGHGRKGLARVYDQHRYTDEMREALGAWALRLRAIVNPPVLDNVVPLAKENI